MRIIVITRPMIVMYATGSAKLPRVIIVAGEGATRCEFCMPIKVIKRPMPPLIPAFNEGGMAAMSACRKLVSDNIRKINEEIKTLPKADCQGTPIPMTITKVKYALRPSPGAIAIG